MRHITAQSGQGDFDPAQPLCVFVQFVFDAPLAGLEVLEMFQYEIFSVVCHYLDPDPSFCLILNSRGLRVNIVMPDVRACLS